MTKFPSLLVFSDLDGTLLDHQSYGWDDAQPGLERLKSIGAGLVLASSKTSAEIGPLRQQIGWADFPAIVENGAGILWPSQNPQGDDAEYLRLREILQSLTTEFRGFGDMTAQEVAERTGLSQSAAHLARHRQYSEPGVWTGTKDRLHVFLNDLAGHGLLAREGGRFVTVSFGQTKADAMRKIVDKLQPDMTIALGDAPNDVEMIEAADMGVIVANPSAPDIPVLRGEAKGRIVRTQSIGPAGWAEAVLSLTSNQGFFRGSTRHG